ncbi:MAG TPA: shikimate dehydrogenase [Lentisphaeria bacterium]|nr:shikimate dehydrogenase [Lentisphaeria bacterium]HCG51557.1 shikimate dehydrogenase [Lentisphaeria bacterium]
MLKKKIYAVIGCPVSHSLSPVMHNAALKALGLDAEYIAVLVPKEELEAFTLDARKNLAGFNITVPHKNAVIPFLDEISRDAELSGSVNTVTVSDGKLSGVSTDGYGLEAALAESFRYVIRDSSVTFIGCGGVVKALTFHFALHGIRKIHLLNRTLETAEKLAATLKEEFPLLSVETASISDDEKVGTFLNDSRLAVQCTSLGLKPEDPSPIRPELLPRDIFFYDTIYKRTKLYAYAEEHGIPAASGLSMLLHQGAKSLSIWTGLEAPVEVMRKALLDAARI